MCCEVSHFWYDFEGNFVCAIFIVNLLIKTDSTLTVICVPCML